MKAQNSTWLQTTLTDSEEGETEGGKVLPDYRRDSLSPIHMYDKRWSICYGKTLSSHIIKPILK